MSEKAYQSSEKVDTKNRVVIKVGVVGDSAIGKTSLIVKYIEGTFDEDYIETLGNQKGNCKF
jgi:GTP-binding protein of the ras superfamily involved in termination of M-phase